MKWCKGYNPGELTGNYYEETECAVNKFQRFVELDNSDGTIGAKLMKAILNTGEFRVSFLGQSNK